MKTRTHHPAKIGPREFRQCLQRTAFGVETAQPNLARKPGDEIAILEPGKLVQEASLTQG